MSDEKILKWENEEQKEKLEKADSSKDDKTSKLTKTELIETLAEDFLEYVKNNPESCKWKSLTNIFLEYLQEADKEKKDILQLLERKFWRKITFDDIKYFYLRSWYTLFELASREIFKKLKRKEIVKAILEKFLQKFEKNGLDISDVKQVLENLDIKTEQDIENAFKTVSDLIFDKIKWLPEEDKKKFLNLKVRNDEIISYLKKKWLLTDEEYKFLKWEIDDISETAKNEVLNLQSVLLNANIINEVEKINDELDNLQMEIDKIFDFWKLGDILWKYLKNVSFKFSDEEWEKLPEEVKEEIRKCLGFWWDEVRKSCIEEVIFKNQDNPIIKQHIISLIENQIDDKILKSLVKKIVNGDFSSITQEEKEYIFNKLKKGYIDNFLKIVSKFGYDKKVISFYLDSIFDLKNDKLILPNWKELKLTKKIELDGEISNLSDLFDLKPVLELDLIWDNVDYLVDIFPEYFVKVQDKIIPSFSKVKVKLKSGDIVEWYLCEFVDDDWKNKIWVYDNNCIDFDAKPLKILDSDDIENIDFEDEKKISLKSYDEIGKLLLGLVRRKETEKDQENNFEKKVFDVKKTKLDDTEWVSKNSDIENQEKEKIEKAMLEEEIKKFKKEWSKLEWDKNLDFEVGAVFTVRWDTINYPGLNWNWYHAEIVSIDESKGTFKIKLFGGILPLEWEWNEYEIPMKADVLRTLKWEFNEYFYRFKKLENLKNFSEYVKNVNLTDDLKVFEKPLPAWRKTNLSSDWLVNEEWKKISYIWRIKNTKINPNEDIEKASWIDEFFDVFKVEFLEEKVVLTNPYDKSFHKEVDYNTFFAIIWDNDLQPWTEEEFRNTELNYTSTARAGKENWIFWLPFTFRYSIAHLAFAFKEVWNAIKNHFKEEDDFRAAEAFSGIVRWINYTSKIPLLWAGFWLINNFLWIDELWVEAQWELEAKIWKRINAAKSRLERADKWWNHAKVAAKIIEKEIFKEVLDWKELSYKKKLKAAWYLLYALEKWPSEYFRALAKYAWSWMWIKALLWEWHYQKWKSLNQELISQLKKDPTNEEIRNKIVFSEIFYMKDVPELTDLYSSNFGSVIEWAKINMYSTWKAKEVYESEATKWNYYVIYDGLKSYVLNNRPANFMWALWAITERVEDYRNYVDYYKVHLMTILSGFFYNSLWTTYKEEYEKVCRAYWIPIGLFAADYEWIHKVLRILDFIVKQKWIKPWWKKQSFTQYLFWKNTPEEVDVISLSNRKEWEKVITKMEDFWAEYGDDIVRVLDFRDISLLKSDLLTNEDKKTQNAIKEYFNDKVNDAIDENFAYKADLFKTWYSPLYREWVFNLPKIAFNKIALKIEWWEFDWEIKWIAKKIWKSIAFRLDQMEDEADKEETYSFILRKYLLWMGSMYEDKTNKVMFIAGLLSKDKEILNKAIIDRAKDKLWHFYTKDLPDSLLDWLQAFKSFFLAGPSEEEVYKILKENGFSDEEIYQALKMYEKLSWKKRFELEKILSKLDLSNEDMQKLDRKMESMNFDEEDKEKDKERFFTL